jgi:hypothetical protein
MRFLRKALCLCLAFSCLAACVATPGPACAPGEVRNISETLFFGRDILMSGEVSDEQWQDFVANVITPRFPQGLSVWPVNGQWKMADGTIVRENSFALNVVHDDSAAKNTAVEEIMNTYKTRFQQEAVLRIKSTACVSY